MIHIELLASDEPVQEKMDDIIELKAPVQVVLDKKPLPAGYFPNGVEVHLYETVFELMDLLTSMATYMSNGSASGSGQKGFSGVAEFCYTGNFFMVEGAGQDGGAPNGKKAITAWIQFNPAQVDDEGLLSGRPNEVMLSFEEFAKELLLFAITAFEFMVDVTSEGEHSLDELQCTILDLQDQLDREFHIQLDIPEEE